MLVCAKKKRKKNESAAKRVQNGNVQQKMQPKPVVVENLVKRCASMCELVEQQGRLHGLHTVRSECCSGCAGVAAFAAYGPEEGRAVAFGGRSGSFESVILNFSFSRWRLARRARFVRRGLLDN